MLRSCTLHASVVLALWAAFGLQTRKIAEQEVRTREDLARQEEDIRKEQEVLREEVAKETVRDEVRMMLTAVMHDAVEETDLDELLQGLETSLDELFQDSYAGGSWEELEPAARAALRDQAVAALRQHQQALLTRALVAQVRTYVREELVPELQATIEGRLKTQVGKQAEKTISRALDQAKREHALSDQDTRAAANAAADAIETQVATTLRQAITEELVPRASQRVLEVFAKEAKALPIDQEQFQALVHEDIRRALTEELAATDPAATTATTALTQRHHLANAQALAAAQTTVAAQAAALTALAAEQTIISEQPPDEAISKQPAQQAQVAALRVAHTQATAALDAASRLTMDDKSIQTARKATAQAKAVALAKKAETQLRNGVLDDARAAMAASAEALRETAQAMRDAAQDLGRQAEAARQDEALPHTTTLTTTAVTAAAAEAAAQAARDQARDDTNKAVAETSQKIKIDGVLGDAARLSRLADLGRRLDEAAAKLADGRSVGAPSLLPGASLFSVQGKPGTGSSGRKRFQLNREAYERFVKDLQNRMNPANAYGELNAVQGLATTHTQVPVRVAEQVWVSDSQIQRLEKLRAPPVDLPERKLDDPDFPTPAWGGAPMVQKAPVVDGDLSDWGELTHGLPIRWNGGNSEEQRDTGITVHMRWSTQGIFAAYRVPSARNTNGIAIPKPETPYSGDAFEWWLDLDNSRKDSAGKSDTAHQFMFAPNGVQGVPERRFFEYSHGQRRVRPGLHDLAGKGFAAAKADGDGYSVEVFIGRSVLARPILLPGQILAMNVSVNLGNNGNDDNWQWSASKAIGTWFKPDTWGDVVLLGADATLRFTAVDATDAADSTDSSDAPPEWLLSGQPLGLEISDPDMNLRTDLRDRIAATVGVEGQADRTLVILEETAVDSGIFRASVDTVSFLTVVDDHTIAARPGSIIVLTYQDPRAAYGEKNRELHAWIPVAYPAQRLTATPE